ncbi:MAG: CoA-binding protein [Dehalococcoidia bacterium]|nr:CoA-binding protein [Dehalococcoidia bacterium]
MDTKQIAQLDRIFHPRSLAVIGASNNRQKSGCDFLAGFIEAGFPTIYPIHPHDDQVLGLKAYPNIKDVPGVVDYALVATPNSAALQVVSDCAEKGLAGISIYTSGFREVGEQGRALEREIVAVARRGGMRIIGPNCMGIYSPASHLTIRTGMPMVDGSVGLISHSGSLCMFITDGVRSLGMGISKAVSCGNESDLTAVDFLEYYGQDPKTKTIVWYMEGIKDGQRFVRLAREISQIKRNYSGLRIYTVAGAIGAPVMAWRSAARTGAPCLRTVET